MFLLQQLRETLTGYKEVGKIIQNKENGGFNVSEKDEPLLLQDAPSLKKLLNDLAKYL